MPTARNPWARRACSKAVLAIVLPAPVSVPVTKTLFTFHLAAGKTDRPGPLASVFPPLLRCSSYASGHDKTAHRRAIHKGLKSSNVIRQPDFDRQQAGTVRAA